MNEEQQCVINIARKIDLGKEGIEVLHHTKWLELRTKESYVYMHSPWCKGQAVAILPYRRKKNPDEWNELQLLTVMENRPCHGEDAGIYSITGGCDKEGEHPAMTAAREVMEETGYLVNLHDVTSLGTTRDCKASDMLLHLFAVKITDDTAFEEPKKDGSGIEAAAHAVWISEFEAVGSNDPILSQLILRHRYSNLK
jgi:8-oxo-dGTP pyrophosphatase MutT (NUDIX family)